MTFSSPCLLGLASCTGCLPWLTLYVGLVTSSPTIVLNSETEATVIAPPDMHTSQLIASSCWLVFAIAAQCLSPYWTFTYKLDLTFHFRNITKLRSVVSSSEMDKIVLVFVSLCLDYCIALFAGLKKSPLLFLQAAQTAAPRHSSHYRCVTLVFTLALHWF